MKLFRCLVLLVTCHLSLITLCNGQAFRVPDTMMIRDGSNPSRKATVNADGSINIGNWPGSQAVTIATLPLPTGAATEATLALIKAKTDNIDVALSTRTKPADQQHAILDSGSVTANAGTNLNTSALALDATLTGGTQKAITRGGVKGSTIAADITSTASGVNHQLIDIGIYDASGNQITSFGGGTQYTEDAAAATDPIGTSVILVRQDTPAALVSANGDNVAQRGTNYGAAYSQIVTSAGAFVDTFGGGTQFADGAARGTATGTLMMVDDGTNIQSAAGNASGELITQAKQSGTWTVQPGNTANTTAWKVDGSAVTQPVSGTVTANAGTNLNTSALALETGGNLATVKTNTDNLALAQASTTSGQKGNLNLGATTTAAPTYTTAQSNPLSLTTAGALRVDNSAVTQPVSGTFWQATQPVSGTFWQATQPVSGTVTANAGTNLNTSALALETGGNLATVKTNTDNLALAQASTTSGQKGNLALGATTTAAPTYTTAQSNPFSLTTAGALRVDNSAVTQPVSGTFWQATQPVSGTFWQATQPVSGTVTANAGTNLNTSALALESGGNLATVASSVRAEDTASADADKGVGMLAIRKATPANLSGTDGDYEYPQMSAGRLWGSVLIDTALPAGTNVIGHVINDAGSAVIGHVINDTGSTTAVTQATAANLNAQVQGVAASGASKSGNPQQIGGVFNTTQPTVTNGQVVEAQSTARGAAIVATGVDAFTVTSNASTNSGNKDATTQRVVIATDQPALTNAQPANVAQVAGATTSTAASGVQKVGIVGNAGATLDSTIGAATAPTNAVIVGVVYQTTVPALTAGQAVAQQSDTTGSTYVNTTGRATTYRMAVKSFTPVASATSPTFSIQGSATKTVRIMRMVVTTQVLTGTGTPFKSDLILQKYSALTGGTTGSTPTGTLMDGNNAAQTAVCLQYSAVPTTATAIGGLVAAELIQQITASATANGTTRNEFTFGDKGTQGLVLRGTAQYLGITINPLGTTPLMSIWVEWVEDNS